VIEREFSYELIHHVTGLPEQKLLSHLSALKDSELLYERGIYPQSKYIFKHALTREVVYDSILEKRKKRLHEVIGNAIERLYRNSLDEYYEVLGEHYFLSENFEKAAECSRWAGKKAEKIAFLNDAISHAQKRVLCLERLAQTDEVQKQMIDARTVLGLYNTQMNHIVEAKKAVDPIIDLAIAHDSKRRLCQIYTVLGAYHLFVEDNYPEAFEALEKALKISWEVKDIVSLSLASYFLGCALGWNCEYERALDYFQKAVEMNVAAKNLWGIAGMKSHLAYFSYYHHGKIDLQFKTTREALSIAEESGDIYSEGMSCVSHGISCFGRRKLEEAEKHLLKGLGFCERINFPSWIALAQFNLGETYIEMGNFPKSKEYYEKVIQILELNQLLPSWANLVKIGFARSKLMNKEEDVHLESLYALSRNNKIKVIEGWTPRYIGEILLNMNDQHLSEAEHWIQKAIEADQRNRMMFHLGKDYALHAELSKRKADRLKARENLGKAIDIFKECGADGWVVKAEKELATLS
jgi:tetratricopeptide (TPR) repeat protein